MMMRRTTILALTGALIAAVATTTAAQEAAPAQPAPAQQGGLSTDALAKANNPLADMNAINLQNYYVPSLYSADGRSNTMNLRGVVVAGRHLLRATLPLSTAPTQTGYASGIGDLNVFDAILLNGPDSAMQFGVGPLLVMPTNTDAALGARSTWQAGLAAVIVRPLGVGSMVGGLATWQTDFAGGNSRKNINVATAQVFATVSIGSGYYLRATPLMVFDFENDRYLVPFGLGVGKVLPLAGAVANVFIEPQFTVLHKGAGQPAFQVFSGLNLQFLKR